ncbi:MAG: D-aminoacyl-tRNA deacylase [Acidobacteriota bacterium]|jgi:D-tyrosyl-tRNA(Tyr) deacylase
MRAVVQRVESASVTVNGEIVGSIGTGLLVLLGITQTDDDLISERMLNKIIDLRIFPDESGALNRSLLEIGGDLLIVSQFTLYADCRRGRRPSFTNAAPPEYARTVYEKFVALARHRINRVETGRFRAMMDVASVNSGPVTIILDSGELF